MSASRGAHRRRWLGATCAGLSAIVLARAALAEQSSAPGRHDVPSECATRAQWLAAVQARLPPLLRTHPLLETLSVHVESVNAAGAEWYEGELASTGGLALSRSRRVRGATCEEVLDALSFMGALGLERVAADESNGAHPGTRPESEALGGPLEEATSIGADEIGALHTGLEAEQRLRLGAVGFALLQDGLTPGSSMELGIAMRLAWSSPSWQPLFLLGAYSKVPEHVSMAGGGTVRFEHWSSHAVACPWRFPRSGAVRLRPCVELDVGRSSGEGLGVAGATRRSAPWLSSGAQLRAELSWKRLELGASLAGVVPFWRAHFLFAPDQMSFETPTFGFRAGSYASVIF